MRKSWALLVALVGLLAGCNTLGYYNQAAKGHLALMAAARPIADWVEDPATPDALRERLLRAKEIRRFAAESLGLPDNRSYTAFADLQRPAAVWNVFATPELSLELKTWCYPVLGCAGYRGYFERADAEAMAAELQAAGFDVNVVPVPAYSTLGWFNDPLLNTFIYAPDVELARLVFHELSHQIAYARDDTVFNESFATAVEREGAEGAGRPTATTASGRPGPPTRSGATTSLACCWRNAAGWRRSSRRACRSTRSGQPRLPCSTTCSGSTGSCATSAGTALPATTASSSAS
jgi:predicted aminopeptidase